MEYGGGATHDGEGDQSVDPKPELKTHLPLPLGPTSTARVEVLTGKVRSVNTQGVGIWGAGAPGLSGYLKDTSLRSM